jgi:hypothetical protein
VKATYIAENNDYAKHDDPDRHVEVWQPILQDNARCRQVVGQHDDVFEKVVPARREAHGWVDETRCVSREALLVRQPGAHLAEGNHDDVDGKAHEDVADQQRCGAELECRACADDESCARACVSHVLNIEPKR